MIVVAFVVGVWVTLLALAFGLARAAGRSRRLDERVAADLDAVLRATATVTPLDGERWQASS